MHNTLWVPGHFHFYLLLGMVAMAMGFMVWLARTYGGQRDSGLEHGAFWLFAVAGLGFVGAFLASGRESVPRRFAEHMSEWMPYDRVGALSGALVLLATLVFVGRFLTRVRQAAAA